MAKQDSLKQKQSKKSRATDPGFELPFYWSGANSQRLLEIVESYPAIWNPESFEKSVRKKARREALILAADEMGMEDFGPDLLLKKFEHLRDNIHRKIKSGSGDFSRGYYPSARYMMEYYVSKNPQYSLEPIEDFVKWYLPHSIQLLSLIAEYPCIWKKDHHQYRSVNIRKNVFQTICNQMNLAGYDATALQKQYELIRVRVNSKLRQLEKCDGEERARITKEFQFGYFPAAEFLMKEYKRLRGQSLENVPLTDEEDTQVTAEENESELSSQSSSITQSTCRICLKPSDDTFTPIFDADYKCYGLHLDEVFQQTINFTVITDQPFYPASLCGSCEQELLQSYLFKLKCGKTEEFLEKLYNCRSQEEADELYASRGEMEIDPLEQTNSEFDETENFEDDVQMKTIKESKSKLKEDDDYKMESAVHRSNFIEEEYIEEVDYETIEESHPNGEEDNEEERYDEIFDEKNSAPANGEVDNEEEYNEIFDRQILAQENGEEENYEEVDDAILEQQISEQLKILENSAPYAKYRVPEKRVPCEFCGKLLALQSMKTHINRMHSGDLPRVQCDICAKFLKDDVCLRSHMKAKHSTVKKRLYRCRYCDHLSSSEATRRYHERIHHEDGKQFVCTVCGKSFLSATRLKVHMPLHTGAKQFECSACGKLFTGKYQRDMHYSGFHTSIRENCQFCDRQFRTKKACREHTRKHHGSEYEKLRRMREQERKELEPVS